MDEGYQDPYTSYEEILRQDSDKQRRGVWTSRPLYQRLFGCFLIILLIVLLPLLAVYVALWKSIHATFVFFCYIPIFIGIEFSDAGREFLAACPLTNRKDNSSDKPS